MAKIESQNIELRELRDDIKEIKETMKDLAKIAGKQALQNQRIEMIEVKMGKYDEEIADIRKEIIIIDKRCITRQNVVDFGMQRMRNSDDTMSQDTWWTLFIGSAVRHGIWIVFTGLLVPLILYMMGVKK